MLNVTESDASFPIAANSPLRLLVVDDDVKFCRLIQSYLIKHGFDVTCVHEGNEGLSMALSGTFQAIILDVMLPGLSGIDLLRKLRETSNVPVVMLTALGEDETDRIVGLEIGADDYLPKSFSTRELLARLRAVLRRTNRGILAVDEIVAGSLRIDLSGKMVALSDEIIALTPIEYDLLVILAHARGRVKTREQLLNEIRDRDYDIFDRSIDVHISALRRKLQDDARDPRFIRTVRSAGYMFIAGGETGNES